MADLVRYNGRALVSERGDGAPPLAGFEAPVEEFDLRQAIAILRSRIGLIVAITLLGVGAAGFLVHREVPQYRATAVIRLADQRRALTSGIEAAGKDVVFGNTDDPLLSQIEVLRTRTLARAVLDRLRLHSGEAAVDSMLRRLRARPREKTDVLDVEFTSSDRRLAQRTVNAVVAEFQALNARQAQEESRRRRAFLEVQLAEMDSLQAAAQAQLSNFRQREQVFSSRDKFASEQAGLTGLDVRREELVAERRMFESLLNDLGRPRTANGASGLMVFASSPQIGSNPVITTLFSQLLSYEAVHDSLTMGEYGRAVTDPEVQRLAGLIAATRGKLSEALRGHVGALNGRIAALDEVRARSSAQMQTLPNAEAEEVRHVQNVETIRKMADELRGEYQKARIAEAVEGGQVEILDYAPVPQKPVPSRRALKLMLGFVSGLLLASGIAFVLEQLNTSIRAPHELEGALAVPGLAVIPCMSRHNGARRLRLRGRSAGHAVVLETLSAEAEAYRKLRTNLIFAQAMQQLRRVLVTSASPGEGKTTITANLAASYAQQGMRVLVVDADLRRPAQHKVFAVPQAPGLSDVVLMQASLATAIHSTRIHHLFVLPAGTLPENPAELLGQTDTRALLEKLSGEFDLVLIDSSPVAIAADALISATFVDGVIMVVRAGNTNREAALYAVQQVAKVGGNVVGAVLNDLDANLPRYGQKYSYHYGSYKESTAR